MSRRVEIEAVLNAAGIKAGVDMAKAALGGLKSAASETNTTLQGTESASDSAGVSISGLGTVVKSLGAAFGIAVSAAGLMAFLKSVSSEAAHDELALAKVGTQVRLLGIDFKAHSAEISDLASKYQALTGIQDDQVLRAFQRSLALTRDYGQSVKDLGLILDLATTFELDYAGAAMVVAQARAGNTRALRQFIPDLKDEIDAMEKAGASAKDYASMIERISSGATSDAMDTHIGRVKAIKGAWQNWIGEVGKNINESLIPMQSELAKILEFNANLLREQRAEIEAFQKAKHPIGTFGPPQKGGYSTLDFLGPVPKPFETLGPDISASDLYDLQEKIRKEKQDKASAFFNSWATQPEPREWGMTGRRNRAGLEAGGGGTDEFSLRMQEEFAQKQKEAADAMKAQWENTIATIQGGLEAGVFAGIDRGGKAGVQALAKYFEREIMHKLLKKLAMQIAGMLFPGAGAAFGAAKYITAPIGGGFGGET